MGNWRAFLARVECLGNLAIQEEELITICQLERMTVNCNLAACLFLRTNRVGKRHRDRVSGIPQVTLKHPYSLNAS